MYYKAFGSNAAIHASDRYSYEWCRDASSSAGEHDSDDQRVRIVCQSQPIGDNEDEFFFSPQILLPSSSSSSCPNLLPRPCSNESFHERFHSLTALDIYAHVNLTHDALEQIWLSLLDLSVSDRDDYELNEYKLRHIVGLSSQSHSNMNQALIEKSRSHNDLFSMVRRADALLDTQIRAKSFDVTALMRRTDPRPGSTNMGLLQGADISEPFADRLISVSVQSDLESVQSFEQEPTLNEHSSPPTEPLDYVFNYASVQDNDEYDLQPTETSTESDSEELTGAEPVKDAYAELSSFRPHSLSTIPSSRASQYASSVGSDDIFERETRHSSIKDVHIDSNDDDHGLIGSEFSSPHSRPLSSIESRSFTPDHDRVSETNQSINRMQIASARDRITLNKCHPMNI